MHPTQPSLDQAANPRVLMVNPFAGRVRRAAIARIVERAGLEGNAVLEIGKDGTAHDVASRLVRDGVPRVLAAGGDGTWHQVIQVLAHSTTALGVIPLGTSNDLAPRLGVPLDLDGALDALAQARVARVDLLKLDDTHVATVGGFGVAARVAHAAARLKAHPWLRRPAQALSRGVYSATAACDILRHGAQAAPCTVRAEYGPATTRPVSAILLGTVARFGGGLRLARDDELRSGTFCALVVTATTRSTLLGTLLALKAGRPERARAVRYSGLTHFSLYSQTLLGAFADGEWLGLRHRAQVELEPGALRALVPVPRAEAA